MKQIWHQMAARLDPTKYFEPVITEAADLSCNDFIHYNHIHG